MSIIRPAKEPMREEGIWFPPLHRESPFSQSSHSNREGQQTSKYTNN